MMKDLLKKSSKIIVIKMENDKCFVCFEEKNQLFVCCHICSPLICEECINSMNNIYENKCTICQSHLPLGYKKIETGDTEKMKVTERPDIFYLETEEKPISKYYSVKINDHVIENILKLYCFEDEKYYLINSNFPFEYFNSFSILTEKKLKLKSINKCKKEKDYNVLFNQFIPKLFIGSNSVIYIKNINDLKIVYSNSVIYREDFERIIKKYRKFYFELIDNIFYRSLSNNEEQMVCCNFL